MHVEQGSQILHDQVEWPQNRLDTVLSLQLHYEDGNECKQKILQLCVSLEYRYYVQTTTNVQTDRYVRRMERVVNVQTIVNVQID